jgi:hypothetical protein
MGSVSLFGVKPPGVDVAHPSTSGAVFEERVELYLHSPSENFWHVLE